MKAFISYHHSERAVAGRLQRLLADCDVEAFMAHQDISVSEEWRGTILRELGNADIFIALISRDYDSSPWCVQEAGIAVYRQMPMIQFSLDSTIPAGFAASFQAARIDPADLSLEHLIPGLMRGMPPIGAGIVIELIRRSGTFRRAESNFRSILPYADRLSEDQMRDLLMAARENNQIHHATLCAQEYLPPLLAEHGGLIDEEDLQFLLDVCAKYE